MVGHSSILEDFNELLPRGMTLDSCLRTLFPASDVSENCEPSEIENTASISSVLRISNDMQDQVVLTDEQGQAALNGLVNCSMCAVKIEDRIEVKKASDYILF